MIIFDNSYFQSFIFAKHPYKNRILNQMTRIKNITARGYSQDPVYKSDIRLRAGQKILLNCQLMQNIINKLQQTKSALQKIMSFSYLNQIPKRLTMKNQSMPISLFSGTGSTLSNSSVSTIKDQVQIVEMNMHNYRKIHQSQRKELGCLQFQIKKLEQVSRINFAELHKQLTHRVNYLSQLFKNDCEVQQRQFSYIEMQNSALFNQHSQLGQLQETISNRSETIQNCIGL